MEIKYRNGETTYKLLTREYDALAKCLAFVVNIRNCPVALEVTRVGLEDALTDFMLAVGANGDSVPPPMDGDANKVAKGHGGNPEAGSGETDEREI